MNERMNECVCVGYDRAVLIAEGEGVEKLAPSEGQRRVVPVLVLVLFHRRLHHHLRGESSGVGCDFQGGGCCVSP